MGGELDVDVGDGNNSGNLEFPRRRTLELPRILIIGAGARGNTYAREASRSGLAVVWAVAEPISGKREALGKKYIWGGVDVDEDEGLSKRQQGKSFGGWREFIQYEERRRADEARGDSKVQPGVDAVFVCTLDDTHREIILALMPLKLHIMAEKPLATTLNDCISIYRSLKPSKGKSQETIFSVGHVLRYSPHNRFLREVLTKENIIGEILSIEHTEPVGWWHFSHSYVRYACKSLGIFEKKKMRLTDLRGNWRKESTTAPSLLTKSCHDLDFLLWMLASPDPSKDDRPPHLPTHVMSTGSLKHFKPSRKPALAGRATNCLSCPAEPECIYSAKKIYLTEHLAKGITNWPINIVVPEMEDFLKVNGSKASSQKLLSVLAENYDNIKTPQKEVDARSWFGRCVYESDNDVCDDQVVTITWEDNPLPRADDGKLEDLAQERLRGRGAKTAVFHMIAHTEKQCERRGRIYGTLGELEYDSKVIKHHDFVTETSKTIFSSRDKISSGGHGGGDQGLTVNFVKAVHAVKNKLESVEEAQKKWIGCSIEDVIRSHGMVFAAEEARNERKVVDMKLWWERVDRDLGG